MFNIFKRKKKETDLERRHRIASLAKDVDCGLMSPPMDPQVALTELQRYFLGEDWYEPNPCNQEQVNTRVVYTIESLYKGIDK